LAQVPGSWRLVCPSPALALPAAALLGHPQRKMRCMSAQMLLALALVGSSAPTVAAKKALLSTDIFYGTGELIYDVYDMALGRILESPTGAALKDNAEKTMRIYVQDKLPADPLGLVCEKVGIKQKDVMDAWGRGQDMLLQAKTTARTLYADAHVYLTKGAAMIVDKFDEALPKHKGLIGKSFEDLLFFTVYMGIVLYVLVRMASFALRIVFCILSCVCCCGCCCLRRRKQPAAANGKNGKKTAAVEKGKAAANGTAKAAAAPANGGKKVAAKK